MTHAIYYEIENNNKEKEILEILKQSSIDIKEIDYIIDNINASTINVTKTEIVEIVKTTFTIFREYLFLKKDFKFGWTFPFLTSSVKGNINVIIPNTTYFDDDRSFISEEDSKYFEENEKWKLKRRGEWKVSRENLTTFLDSEIENYRKDLTKQTSEALCAMMVSLKYFKVNFPFQKEIMKELASRREKGESFAFEEYIKKEFLALPKATLNFDNFAEAFKDFKL